MDFVKELKEKTNNAREIIKQKKFDQKNKELAILKSKYKNYFDENIKPILILEADNGNSNSSIFIESLFEDGLIESGESLNETLFIQMLVDEGFEAHICNDYEDYDDSNPYVYISWE